jgi:IS5 family transposase
MKQQPLAVASGFERFGKRSRRAEFLAAMEPVVPWGELVALIEPHYPDKGKGRPPVGVERMLRIYFLQQWFNLSDPGVEDAMYDSLAMRGFVGIDVGREPAPDETTVCKFRHLLERHGLGERIFALVNEYLEKHGLKIGTGTIVDATILNAPSSTKNKSGARDSEMHQVRKGRQWYFGMKAHVGVDAESKLIHSVAATAANVADCRMLPALLHGNETDVWGDQAYQGQADVLEHAPKAADRINRRWRTKLKTYPGRREENRVKSKTPRSAFPD